MDNKKEKKSAQRTSLPSPATTTANPATTHVLPSSNNDCITTTTSSESLESWTLVTNKDEGSVKDDSNDDSDNHVETLRNSDNDEDKGDTESEKETETETETEAEAEQETEPERELLDSTNDDLSDGISVISENESVGRISPHSDEREFMNYSLSETGNELRQRRRFSSEAAAVSLRHPPQAVVPSSGVVSLVKRGVKGIFYIGVLLAILGLIGKVVNPTWKPLSKLPKSDYNAFDLMQKIGVIELKNKFLSDQLDALNKKVEHLSARNEPHEEKPSKRKEHKEGETFEAWPGNGDTLQPVDITKEDLREPYKSPEQVAYQKVQEKRKNWPTEPDRIMRWFLRQGKRFNNFDELDAELRKLQDYDYIIEQFNFLRNEYAKPENQNVHKIFKPDSKETQNKFDKNNSKEKKYRKDNSKERPARDFNESKENSNEDESKEGYSKQKHKHVKKNGGDFSGEWQDNYMKHREQQRKENDQKHQNNKNWYIKRGDSRENKRSGEKKFR